MMIDTLSDEDFEFLLSELKRLDLACDCSCNYFPGRIKVTGYNTASDEEQTWYISLQNNGEAVIKDMKIGSEYKVEEISSWTVYYDTPTMGYPAGALEDGKYEILPYNAGNVNPNTVTITNSPNPDKWLHDENYAINFSNKTPSSGDGK